MAKKKLNVKFLALVLAAVGVGVAVIGLVVLMQFRNDPVRHVKRGDALMTEGAYENAMMQYVRAIGKKPSEMDYYDRAMEASSKIEPNSRERAFELFGQRLAILAKQVEYATDRETRDARAAQLMDELQVMTFALPRVRGVTGTQPYEFVAARLGDLGRNFELLPEDEVGSRIRAAVEGRMAEPVWRGAYVSDIFDWEDSVDDLIELIEIEPSYMPNHYGLLRGQLDRLETDGIRSAASADELEAGLKSETGFDTRLAIAREAVTGPAPELALLAFERDHVLFFAGLAGESGLTEQPDPADLDEAIKELGALTRLAEDEDRRFEVRRRLFEIWHASQAAQLRRPTIEVELETLVGLNDGYQRLRDAAAERIIELDAGDLRSGYVVLVGMPMNPEAAETSRERIADVLAQADEATTLGVDNWASYRIRPTALQRAFELELLETPFDQVLDEEAEARLAAAHQAIYDSYADDELREQSATWQRNELLYKSRLSESAARKAATTDDTVLAREAREESMQYAIDGGRAANLFRENADSIDMMAINAGLTVARRLGQSGTALQLLETALERNATMAADLGIQARYAVILADAGDFGRAKAILQRLRPRIDQSDTDLLATVAEAERLIRMAESGQQAEDLPGSEFLTQAAVARAAGNIDERRRVLDLAIEGDRVHPTVRLLALIERGMLEESEGDYESMRMYATRALEIDPDSVRAKLLLQSDSSTTGLERSRRLAEIAYEHPEDVDVQQAKLLRSALGDNILLDAEEIEELRAELASLDARIAAIESKRPLALEYEFGRALSASDFDAAAGYLDAIENPAEGQPGDGETARTILLRAGMEDSKGDLDKAIQVIRDAIDNKGYGSDGMHIALGELYLKRGDREDAVREFDEAFAQAPNRFTNALALGKVLLAEGRMADGLQVLRAGRSNGRNNETYRDLWLFAEIQAGNFDAAIKERRRIYVIDPFAQKNAVELARLLAESPVDRESIVHLESDPRSGAVEGEPMYTLGEWSRLSRSERRKLQAETQALRTAEASGIFANLLEKDPTSPELVVGAVRFGEQHPDYEVEGDPLGRAERMLRDSVSKDTGARRRGAEGRLARILAEKGRKLYLAENVDEAEAVFDEVVEMDRRRDGEATTVIASFLLSQADYNRSVKYQAALLETLEGLQADEAILRGVAAQLAKLHIAVDDNESAEAIADRYFVEVENDSNQLTILGTIAFGKADAIRRSEGIAEDGGLSSEVVDLLGLAESRYDRAIELNALNRDARVQLSTLKEYEWLYAVESERQERLEEAIKTLRAVLDTDQMFWAARQRLVGLLERADRLDEAAAELRDYIELVPDLDAARQTLLGIYQRDGRTKEAIEVAQEALDRDPTSIPWAFTLGRLRQDEGEHDLAAQLYASLFDQTQNPAYLRAQVRALMSREVPAVSEIRRLTVENQRLFRQDPVLLGGYCVALVKGGEKSDGLRQFESTYRSLAGRDDPARSGLSQWLDELFSEDPDGAADLAAFVERISDGDPSVVDLLEVASAWNALGSEGRDEAITATRRALDKATLDTELLAALTQLGVLYSLEARYEEAIDSFEKALGVRPDDIQLLNNLAYLGAKSGGDLDLALERAERASRESPYRGEYRDTLGAVWMAMAKAAADDEDRQVLYRKARQELELASRLNRRVPSPLIQLAELEIELGNPDKARRFLAEASDREPSEELQAEIERLLELVRGG